MVRAYLRMWMRRCRSWYLRRMLPRPPAASHQPSCVPLKLSVLSGFAKTRRGNPRGDCLKQRNAAVYWHGSSMKRALPPGRCATPRDWDDMHSRNAICPVDPSPPRISDFPMC